jgi:hypothetical protein
LAVGAGHERAGSLGQGSVSDAARSSRLWDQTRDELLEAIDASYDAVVSKLPKKDRPTTS